MTFTFCIVTDGFMINCCKVPILQEFSRKANFFFSRVWVSGFSDAHLEAAVHDALLALQNDAAMYSRARRNDLHIRGTKLKPLHPHTAQGNQFFWYCQI
jgi:hypothetical protein